MSACDFGITDLVPVLRGNSCMVLRKELPHSDVTQGVIDSYFDVIHELGTGFSEDVTQRALAIVLRARGFHLWERAQLAVSFRGQNIGTFFADMIVNDVVLVEIRAMPRSTTARSRRS